MGDIICIYLSITKLVPNFNQKFKGVLYTQLL